MPSLHRNIDIHTSFQTFKHLEECAWQSCNTEVRGGVPFFFLLSALAASLSKPWFNVHIYSVFLCHRQIKSWQFLPACTETSSMAVGMWRCIPKLQGTCKLCSTTACIQVCPSVSLVLLAWRLHTLILDLHGIKMHACKMHSVAKQHNSWKGLRSIWK